MQIKTNREEFLADIYDIAHLFFPHETLKEQGELIINHNLIQEPNKIYNHFEIVGYNIDDNRQFADDTAPFNDEIKEKSLLRKFIKRALYKQFSELTGVAMPWGSLTGIRPTKLARELINDGYDPTFIEETLIKEYYVSEEKAKLVARVLKNQKSIIRNENLIDLYINIPVCPTRCSYCSFISSELKSVSSIMPNYLEALLKEIDAVKKIIASKPYVVRTIYIGGGTPTVLNPYELDLLLNELNFPISEFTVECGRPDTIDEDKLRVLKAHGVTRISINPQTFSPKTLKIIGRNHTIKQVIDAYVMAMKMGFRVNMDLIAGLPEESLRTFKKNIDTILELSPDNVTVHTLSIKRGASLDNNQIINSNVKKMVDYAYKKLTEDGYRPYYLYRQKNQLGGLENVGYCKQGTACIFNIDSMEETCSIIACGANAASKKVNFEAHKIDRQFNHKFIHDYIAHIDDIIYQKQIFFS